MEIRSFIQDNQGKKSSSRAISLLSTVVICTIAVSLVFLGGRTTAPPDAIIYGLVTMALGPIGFNRWREYVNGGSYPSDNRHRHNMNDESYS